MRPSLSFSRASLLALLACFAGCTSGGGTSPGDDASTGGELPDGASLTDAPPPLDASIPNPCSLPGTVQYTAGGGTQVVPGGSGRGDLSFLKLPAGFCAHYYGNVGNARQIRFAPGGELFVASPTRGTTGGGGGGKSEIDVLPDDDLNGEADSAIKFLGNLPATQGMLFTPGSLYYQDDTQIMQLPYQRGQRAAAGTPTSVLSVTIYSSSLHWPKVLDAADDGTIYVGNGGDQGETCDPTRPFHGGIVKVDPTVQSSDPLSCGPSCSEVAKGLRNPIALRCQHGHDNCFALELALDYSGADGGREKLLPIRQGDDWGFPCCASKNLPYATLSPAPDCSATASEFDAFVIGDTPFGIDFAPATWPAPYSGAAFVTLHGVAGNWQGERLVSIAVDPTSGMPMTGNDLMMVDMGAIGDFGTGWDDGSQKHGRPSAVAFSSDGRLFVANDNDGDIFWIAPMAM